MPRTRATTSELLASLKIRRSPKLSEGFSKLLPITLYTLSPLNLFRGAAEVLVLHLATTASELSEPSGPIIPSRQTASRGLLFIPLTVSCLDIERATASFFRLTPTASSGLRRHVCLDNIALPRSFASYATTRSRTFPSTKLRNNVNKYRQCERHCLARS